MIFRLQSLQLALGAGSMVSSMNADCLGCVQSHRCWKQVVRACARGVGAPSGESRLGLGQSGLVVGALDRSQEGPNPLYVRIYDSRDWRQIIRVGCRVAGLTKSSQDQFLRCQDLGLGWSRSAQSWSQLVENGFRCVQGG